MQIQPVFVYLKFESSYNFFFFLAVFLRKLVKIENIVTRTFSIQLNLLEVGFGASLWSFLSIKLSTIAWWYFE